MRTVTYIEREVEIAFQQIERAESKRSSSPISYPKFPRLPGAAFEIDDSPPNIRRQGMIRSQP